MVVMVAVVVARGGRGGRRRAEQQPPLRDVERRARDAPRAHRGVAEEERDAAVAALGVTRGERVVQQRAEDREPDPDQLPAHQKNIESPSEGR